MGVGRDGATLDGRHVVAVAGVVANVVANVVAVVVDGRGVKDGKGGKDIEDVAEMRLEVVVGHRKYPNGFPVWVVTGDGGQAVVELAVVHCAVVLVGSVREGILEEVDIAVAAKNCRVRDLVEGSCLKNLHWPDVEAAEMVGYLILGLDVRRSYDD
jgi:hypothetical protein